MLRLRSSCTGSPNGISCSEARSRLDQRRFSRPNTHFSAFFENYKNIVFSPANFVNFCKNFAKKLANFAKNFKIFQNFEDFAKILPTFCKMLPKFCKICSREDDFFVDLEKCCKMRPWLQKSASIQPRTSPGKSDVSWLLRAGFAECAATPELEAAKRAKLRSLPLQI